MIDKIFIKIMRAIPELHWRKQKDKSGDGFVSHRHLTISYTT